jgi:hypothetical protein
MSFIVYDLAFLVVFSLAVALFLYVKRKKLVREGIMFLYKTSVGLKFIDYFGKKYPKTTKFLSYIIVATGYLLMIAAFYFLIQILLMFTKPEIVKLVRVPPIMPLIPYIGEIFNATWLPKFYFTYWIIAIALVAIFHEGAHGIFAKFNKIRIKSTGFGFLGPFLAFFVEQDDKQMRKAKIFPQLTVLGAGVFANIILAVIFLFALGGFFSATYAPAGVIFSDYSHYTGAGAILSEANITNEIIAIDGSNATKIIIDGKNYWVRSEYLLNESLKKDNETGINFYHDLPALRNSVAGYIIQINNHEIKTNEDLIQALNGKKPGEVVRLITAYKTNGTEGQIYYEFELGADYSNSSRGVIGIMSSSNIQTSSTHSIRVFIGKLVNRFQDPSIHYESKINPELATFIYYLI